MKNMMKKLVLVSLGLVVGSFTACVGVDPQGRGYSVAVPMGMINSTLANQFPVKESRSFGTVEIKDPDVLGQQGSEKLSIGTAFNVSSMLMPNGLGGSLKLSSGVRFDPKTQNLYLANPMVEDLKFQDFSLAKYLTNDMRNALGLLIAETISKKPIYNISKAGMGSGFVRGIDVRDGQIFLTFGL
ncbi:MAG: Unknown protein [uncultured Sulfurovum sp.]|uniref:DUF1439 domain-containing protein n=1 Tax=uncultured Sulfurovum sp. TaxID=269237 RepID=A0A6S6TLG3_9BACT|nr:MAG: Unknown protein [uncultured Sulfurovum sp.]